jgi:hypothetical protein
MRFETKIAVVVRDDLAAWQKLNVACFLRGGLVGAYPELAGERYVDGSGRLYGPLIRQPILVYAANAEEIRRRLRRANDKGLGVSIYTGSYSRPTTTSITERLWRVCLPRDSISWGWRSMRIARKSTR